MPLLEEVSAWNTIISKKEYTNTVTHGKQKIKRSKNQ